MYVSLNVTKWKNHVSELDKGGREFVVNPSKITELWQKGTGSKFYLADYYLSRRDAPSYVECDESVQTIKDAYDVVSSETITLPVYKNNNILSTPANVTIPTNALVYATRYNRSPLNTSWVLVEEGAFSTKAEKALVALSVEDIVTGASLLMDYDNNRYTTIVIGSQEWTVENYRTTHYSDGTEIPNITDNDLWQADTDGAYCYYDNDATNFDFIALLYNWYAVTNVHGFPYLKRGGVQELGWRVPTIADWTALIGVVGGWDVAGGMLKEVGTVHWDSPNTDATDTYGFKWISGGNRYIDEPFGDGFASQGIYGDIWTSDDGGVTAPSIYAYNESAELLGLYVAKFIGMNVRLVRDI